jgi:glc operon protein GlcG
MRTKEKAPPRTGPSVSLQLKFWSAEGAAFLPARTAVEFRRPTKALEDVIAGGGAGLRYFTVPGVNLMEGGVPIVIDGKIVGGIGVSGVDSKDDAQIAQAGAAAVR